MSYEQRMHSMLIASAARDYDDAIAWSQASVRDPELREEAVSGLRKSYRDFVRFMRGK